jgi:hypothetical protein
MLDILGVIGLFSALILLMRLLWYIDDKNKR